MKDFGKKKNKNRDFFLNLGAKSGLFLKTLYLIIYCCCGESRIHHKKNLPNGLFLLTLRKEKFSGKNYGKRI